MNTTRLRRTPFVRLTRQLHGVEGEGLRIGDSDEAAVGYMYDEVELRDVLVLGWVGVEVASLLKVGPVVRGSQLGVSLLLRSASEVIAIIIIL